MQLAVDLRAQRPEVIGDLLAEFGRELQGVAYLILRNHADAEEVVMDTLVTAWRRGRDLREDRALRTWLLRIATRHALSRRRRREHPTKGLGSQELLVSPPVDRPSVERLIVAEALGELPPRMRAAVVLHHYAGLTVPQVAESLNVTQNTVKTHLRDGMARLRAALADPTSDSHQALGQSNA